MLPPNPVASEFDPIVILYPMWSPRAVTERNRFVATSNRGERDPTIAIARPLVAYLQNL